MICYMGVAVDLIDHINLVNNHGYDGYLAIYTGPDNMAIKKDAIVVVQNERHYEPDHNRGKESCDWLNTHRTIEIPLSNDQINKQIERGSLMKTFGTTIGVPTCHIKRIKI